MPDTPQFPASQPDDGTTPLSRPQSAADPDGDLASASAGLVVAAGSRPAARMRTMVFGLILLVVAGAVLAGQLTSVQVDAGVVALTLMVGAGLLLIIGSRRAAS